MQINGVPLGVQSWCFRNFRTHAEVIAAVRACGLSVVEMSVAHIDVADAAAVDDLLACYRQAGIALSSHVQFFSEDEADARRIFDFGKKANFATLGALPSHPNVLPMLDRLSQEYGIKIAIHNHGRLKGHRFGMLWALEDAFAETSPNVGLCLDTAWLLDVGEDPCQVARRFADRLYGVHLKDFIFNRDGAPVDVVIGTGNLQLEQFLSTLRDIEFSGYLSLEYEGNPDNPIPDVQACLAQLRAFADDPHPAATSL